MAQDRAGLLLPNLSISEMGDYLRQELRDRLAFDGISITILNPDPSNFLIRYIFGSTDIRHHDVKIISREGTQTQQVLRDGKTLIRGDVAAHPEFTGDRRLLDAGIRSTIMVPLVAGDQVIGAMSLRSQQFAAYGVREQVLLEEVARRLAAVADQAYLFDMAHLEISLMDEVARVVDSTPDIDEAYPRFAASLQKLVPYDYIAILTVNETENAYTCRYLSDPLETRDFLGVPIPLAGTLTQYVVTTGKTCRRDDLATAYPRFPVEQTHLNAGLRACIITPLVSKGRIIGAISLRSSQAGTYGGREQTLVERLAHEIAPAVERASLYRQLEASADELATAHEVAKIVTSTLNIDEVYEQFALEVKKLVPFDRMNINVIDHHTQTRIVKYVHGPALPGIDVGDHLPLENTATQHIVETGESLISNDVANIYRFDQLFLDLDLISRIAVPLICKGQVIAVLYLHSQQANSYGVREQAILEGLASQIAPAVENAQLYDQAKAEMAAVDEVARIVTSTLDIDQVYEQFAREVKKLVGFERMSINLIDLKTETLLIKYLYGPTLPGRNQGDTVALPGTLTQQLLTGELGPTPDAKSLEDRRELEEGYRELGLISSTAALLKTKGSVIGNLSLRSRQEEAYGPREQAILERLASQIAPAVENAYLHEQLQAEMAAVHEVAQIVTSTLDIDQVYEQFAQEIKKLVDFDRIAINTFDPLADTLTFRYVAGITPAGREKGASQIVGNSRVREALSTGCTVISEGLPDTGQSAADVTYQGLGLRTIIIVPLISKGRVIGILSLRSRSLGAYGPREQAILEGLACQIAPAVENAQLYEQVQQEMSAVDEVARIVTSTLDIDQVYEQFAQEVKKLVDFERAVISLVDQEAGTYTIKYQYGLPRPGWPVGQTGRLADSPNNLVVTIKETVVREGLDYRPIFASEHYAEEMGLRASIIVPLISKGQVIGTFGLRSRHAGVYGLRERIVLERLASQIAPALENARLYQEALQAAELTRRTETQYRELFDEAPIGYQEIDVAGCITQVNRTKLEMLGYTAGEMLGRYVWEFAVEEGSCRRFIMEGLSGVAEAPRGYECQYQRKDGSLLYAMIESRPLRDDSGNIRGLRCTVQDITEWRQTEERLRETARLASIGELAAGVAHEINNPLTSVLGFSQLLLEQDLPPDVRSDLSRIMSEAQRASRVVQNLLSFARKREPEMNYLDLIPVLDRALELKSYDFRISNIEVSRRLPDRLAKTMLDEHQLTQVILNILNNAEHSMRAPDRTLGWNSGNAGQLVISAVDLGDKILISIADNGPGIPPEQLRKIFEPFYTTKAVGESTGLGLSICYGIVQRHGGELWAESPPGQGATFHIELPIVGQEAKGEDAPAYAVVECAFDSVKHLLVVEDDPSTRDLLNVALSLGRYTVDLAKDGKEALEKINSRDYDCIITDLKMPGMGGQELYYQVTAASAELAKRMIFITGDVVTPETAFFVDTVDNPTLTKPLDMMDLRQAIIERLQVTERGR